MFRFIILIIDNLKKIASIIERFYPLSGGSENQLLNLSQELLKHNTKNIIITKKFSNSPDYEVIDQIEIYRIVRTYFKLKGKINTFIFLMYFIPFASMKILKMRKKINCVYFVGGNYLYGIIAWICRKNNIKTCVKIVTTMDGEIGHLKGHKLFKMLKIILANKFDFLIATTKYIESALIKEGYDKTKIIKIPNGVDTDLFAPNNNSNLSLDNFIDKKNNYIVYTGRLSKHKNLPLLINSFISIKIKYKIKNWKLIIIGEGKMIDDPIDIELKKIVIESGFNRDIFFTGKVDDVYNYLKFCSIFVLPSKKEGLPNCLIEAMSCELACIGSDVQGINDLIEHNINGLLFDLNNKNALIETLYLLIKNADLRDKLSKNAREMVLKNYSFDMVAEKYSRLFFNL